MRFSFLAFAVCVLLYTVILAPTASSAAGNVDITAAPEYQSPNQRVTLTARTLAPKGSYDFTWSVDGQVLAEGVDQNSIVLFAGNAGSETVVTLQVSDLGGEVAGEATYTIRPASVDIVWEGQTSVPPYYQGLPLPNSASLITLQAVPNFVANGVATGANELVYTWTVNGDVLQTQSGYGKSFLTVPAPKFRNSFAVRVLAETRDGIVAAKGSATIPLVKPLLALYEDKPLSGLQLNRAVTPSGIFTGDEMTFTVFPVFFSNPDALTYSWNLNDQPLTSDTSHPEVATFRKTGNGKGVFSVGIAVTNVAELVERVVAKFTLSLD